MEFTSSSAHLRLHVYYLSYHFWLKEKDSLNKKKRIFLDSGNTCSLRFHTLSCLIVFFSMSAFYFFHSYAFSDFCLLFQTSSYFLSLIVLSQTSALSYFLPLSWNWSNVCLFQIDDEGNEVRASDVRTLKVVERMEYSVPRQGQRGDFNIVDKFPKDPASIMIAPDEKVTFFCTRLVVNSWRHSV